jgi:hypothetical protein
MEVLSWVRRVGVKEVVSVVVALPMACVCRVSTDLFGFGAKGSIAAIDILSVVIAEFAGSPIVGKEGSSVIGEAGLLVDDD